MKYLKVKWIHNHSDDPVWLYSELNDASREIRKVEVYADGSFGFADERNEAGGSSLGLEPVPPITDIAADTQFVPTEIEKEEFEEIWNQRLSHP